MLHTLRPSSSKNIPMRGYTPWDVREGCPHGRPFRILALNNDILSHIILQKIPIPHAIPLKLDEMHLKASFVYEITIITTP
jgi:hypothetical protein